MSDRSLTRRMLENDLRLFWRSSTSKKASWATSTLGRLGMLALLHFVVLGMFSTFEGADRPRGGPELACLVATLFVAMTALHRSLEVLYNRGDLPLLLSSPVPARVVMLTRLVDITVTSVLGTALLLLPMLDVAIVEFGWHWLWGYVTWISVALLVVPAAVLTTLVAVERLGVRRARTFVQLFGILIGMAGIVATQLPNWVTASSRAERHAARQSLSLQMYSWFDLPVLRQLADAASGAWQWSLPLAGGGVVLFVLAMRALAVRFTHGAQSAAEDGGGGRRRTRTAGATLAIAFARPRWRVLLHTQLLLLRRDPMLLMRCAMQIVSLVPMLFGAMMLSATAGIGGVGLMAAAIVPIQLAAMMNANDEAFEFVAASPLSRRERALVRSVAVATPLIVFVAVMAIVLALLAGPIAAFMVLLGGTTTALGSAWCATCATRAHTAEQRARQQRPRIGGPMLLGMLIAGVGTAALGVREIKPWLAFGLFVGSLGLASLLFLFHPRQFESDN